MSQEADEASSMLGLNEDILSTSLPEREAPESLLDENNNHFRRSRTSLGRSRNRDCARISGYWPQREKSRSREYNKDNSSCAHYVNRRFLETKFREEPVRPNENNSGMDCYVNPPVLRCPPYDTNNQDVTLTPCQIDILLTLAATYCSNTAMVDSCKFALLSCDYNSVVNNYLIAAKFQLCDVMDRLLDQIRANFKCVSRTKEFLSLPLDVVKMFLQDNFINVDNELDIFFAALNWVDFNKMQRLPDAGKLLNCVRYVYINPRDILQYVEPNLHLFTGPEGMEAMLNIYRYRALILSGTIPPPPNVMAYCVPNATFSQEPVYQTPSDAIGLTVPPMRNDSPERYMMTPPQEVPPPPSPPPQSLPFMCVPNEYQAMTMPPSVAMSPIYTPYNDTYYSSRLTVPGTVSPLRPATPQNKLRKEPSEAPSRHGMEAVTKTDQSNVAEEARSKESVAKKKVKAKPKKEPKTPQSDQGSHTFKEILTQLKSKKKEKHKPKTPEKDIDTEESSLDNEEEPTSPKKVKNKKPAEPKLIILKKSKSKKTPDNTDMDKEGETNEDKKDDDGAKAGLAKDTKKAKSTSAKKVKLAHEKSKSDIKKGDQPEDENSDDDNEKGMKGSDSKSKKEKINKKGDELGEDENEKGMKGSDSKSKKEKINKKGDELGEDEKKNVHKQKVDTDTQETEKKKDADEDDQVEKGDKKKKKKDKKQTKKEDETKSVTAPISPSPGLKEGRSSQSAQTSFSQSPDLKKDRSTKSAQTSRKSSDTKNDRSLKSATITFSPSPVLKKDRSTKSAQTSRKSSDTKNDLSSKSAATSVSPTPHLKKEQGSKSTATSRKSSQDISTKSKRKSSRDKRRASDPSPSPEKDKDEAKKGKRKSSKHGSHHGKKDEGRSGHKSKSKEGEGKASESTQPGSTGSSGKHHKHHRKTTKSKSPARTASLSSHGSRSGGKSTQPARPSRRGTVFLDHTKVHKPKKP